MPAALLLHLLPAVHQQLLLPLHWLPALFGSAHHPCQHCDLYSGASCLLSGLDRPTLQMLVLLSSVWLCACSRQQAVRCAAVAADAGTFINTVISEGAMLDRARNAVVRGCPQL
jgi:hypothetical protein